MEIQIPQVNVIKQQRMTIDKDVSIIYGYNNSGKTSILKAIYTSLETALLTSFLSGGDGQRSVYIPTNRLIYSPVNTKDPLPEDVEDFVSYQRGIYDDYSLHLKHLRDYLLGFHSVSELIRQRLGEIFGMEISDLHERHSDGIENIIHIYLCIIWEMVWDRSVDMSKLESLRRGLAGKNVLIMIDEIEMFLHVKVQAKLISSLKADFVNSQILLTTHSPLILTRYKNCAIYCIDDGVLTLEQQPFYYRDLDDVFESFFSVDELPPEVSRDISYLGRVILRECPYDGREVDRIAAYLREDYPSLYQKYNRFVVKAQGVGESLGGERAE